jgi:hypothetical protein
VWRHLHVGYCNTLNLSIKNKSKIKITECTWIMHCVWHQCFIQNCNSGEGGGGVSGGADTKRRCKIFDDLFFTNFLLFPAKPGSNHSSLPSSTSSLPSSHLPARSRKHKHNLILLLSNRRAISSMGSRATPQKKILVIFPRRGPTLRPGGGWAPRANAWMKHCLVLVLAPLSTLLAEVIPVLNYNLDVTAPKLY